MRRKKKKDFVDDGTSFADMNIKGMPWYQSPEMLKKKESLRVVQVSKKERRAMIKGAFLAYLPLILVIVVSYTAVFLILYFLLKP